MSRDITAPEQEARLSVRNDRPMSLMLRLEPWGEEYSMPSHARFQVVATGPAGGELELEIGDDHITVYGWSGSVVSISCDGVELGESVEARPSIAATR